MSSEHKKPLYAFVVLLVACVVFMGYTARAQAIIDKVRSGPVAIATGLLTGGDLFEPTSVLASAPTLERSTVTEQGAGERSPSADATARPAARPPFGADHRRIAGEARRGATSKKVHRPGHSPAAREAQQRADRIARRGTVREHRHPDHGNRHHDAKGHDRGRHGHGVRDRGRSHHGNKHESASPHRSGHTNGAPHRANHAHPGHRSSHADRGHRSSHGNRGHRSSHGNRGHRSNHGNRGHRGHGRH